MSAKTISGTLAVSDESEHGARITRAQTVTTREQARQYFLKVLGRLRAQGAA